MSVGRREARNRCPVPCARERLSAIAWRRWGRACRRRRRRRAPTIRRRSEPTLELGGDDLADTLRHEIHDQIHQPLFVEVAPAVTIITIVPTVAVFAASMVVVVVLIPFITMTVVMSVMATFVA